MHAEDNIPDHHQRQRLINSLSKKPAQELARILIDLIDDYVSPKRTADSTGALLENPLQLNQEAASFAVLMEMIIRAYRYPELRRFRVQGNSVFFMFKDQELEITPQMENLAMTSSIKDNSLAEGKKGMPHAQENPGNHRSSIVSDTRFKNLEL